MAHGADERRWVRRVLAVAVLLAGLVAMHVLTVGHESTVTPEATGAYAAASTVAAGGGSESVSYRFGDLAPTAQPHHGAVTGQAWLLDGCVGCGHEPADSHGGSHPGGHVLDLCLAVLLLGGSVLLALLARMGGGRGRWVSGRVAAVSVRGTGRTPRVPRPPVLAQLCVLRT